MISELSQSDLPKIVPLFRALNTFHAERIPLRYHCYGTDVEYLTHLTEKFQNGASIWAASDGWGYCAYLMALPLAKQADFLRHSNLHFQLDHVYIAPHQRGSGVMRKLLAAMEGRMAEQGVRTWRVGHYAFNTDAGAVYQNLGAEPFAFIREASLPEGP